MCNLCHHHPCPSACPNAPDPVVGVCAICRQRIYSSEPGVIVDGEAYHAECLDDLSTREKLELFGHDVAEIITKEE
ncbi:MAG: hypothetical protein IJX53_00545 [Clostridia bacterium]|nr:hypothetical protein [Clostridia bacterium]